MACFTFSVHHNAWALARGLERLGLRLEAVSDTDGLVRRTTRRPQQGDVLFFTDERSLLEYVHQSQRFTFHPQRVDCRIVDDKLEWARAVQQMGESPVPFWEVGETIDPPELPVYLKSRHSWRGTRRPPRGYVCHSRADVERAVAMLETAGWDRSQFFWQRLVAGPICNNFSVCGFFDAARPDRSVTIVVQKILGDGPTVMSCGAVVETVPDPGDLRERTARLLTALEFTGPFELEFLRDEASRAFYVLEFNPRFWMQHGLFVDGYDNVVIARYLGVETEARSPQAVPFRSLAWINTMDLVRRIPRLLVSDTERRRVYLELWRRHRRGETRIVWSPGVIAATLAVAADRGRSLFRRRRRARAA